MPRNPPCRGTWGTNVTPILNDFLDFANIHQLAHFWTQFSLRAFVFSSAEHRSAEFRTHISCGKYRMPATRTLPTRNARGFTYPLLSRRCCGEFVSQLFSVVLSLLFSRAKPGQTHRHNTHTPTHTRARMPSEDHKSMDALRMLLSNRTDVRRVCFIALCSRFPPVFTKRRYEHLFRVACEKDQRHSLGMVVLCVCVCVCVCVLRCDCADFCSIPELENATSKSSKIQKC